MCDFISYVEVQRYGKIVPLFLTDDDVFSPHGRETLQGTMDNDCLGHGAIRAFYGLRVGEGIDCEKVNFWDKEAQKGMPEVLRKMLKTSKTFLCHWGKMFEKSFTEDDLYQIIRRAPPKYKVLAWEQLMKRKLSNDDLFWLIGNAPPKYQKLAQKVLDLRKKQEE